MRPCHYCGSDVTTKAGRAVCSGCKVARRASRTVRPCEECGNPHKGRERRCGRCRYAESSQSPCERCGQQCAARAKVCRACRLEQMTGSENPAGVGSRNGRWNGGRTRRNGYVMVYAPEHPACTKARYVAEHTLVMEEVLGRYLLPGENVHHRNGQRDDNRPENLELWVKSQPAGQRAVDLLAWAHEIIDRYDDTVIAEAAAASAYPDGAPAEED